MSANRTRAKSIFRTWAAALVLLLTVFPASAPAQGTGGPVVGDSRVGYIDDAIPGNMFRFRYDPFWDNNRPTRAEFYWPGPGRREISADYQDFTAYLEVAPFERLSAFVDVPVHLINPIVAPNNEGFGDMTAGVKYAFLFFPDLVTSFQFRTYIPTGDADRDLGTGHVSLEPALLCYKTLGEDLTLEGEFRYWVPVGGSDFAGDIIRYGAGLSYNLFSAGDWSVAPVAEVVGWTVLDGLESFFLPATQELVIQDAAGDTIVNLKLGLRLRFGDAGDFYAGYGRPLTGEQWYDDTFRIEFRLFFGGRPTAAASSAERASDMGQATP